MENIDAFIQDEIYCERLLISVNADSRDLAGNIRAARVRQNSDTFEVGFLFGYGFGTEGNGTLQNRGVES